MAPKQLHWLYAKVVRPMIAYGAIAWWTKALQQLARQAIQGANSSTPSAALEILLGLPPLHIYLKREARWTAYRNRQLAINLPQTNIMEHNIMLESIQSHSVLGMVSDGLPARINLDLPYNILLPGRDEWERNRTDLLRADSCWYTDSSKTPEGARAGTQIHAIELCERELEKRGPNCRSIKIFSASQAAHKELVGILRILWNKSNNLEYLFSEIISVPSIPGHLHDIERRVTFESHDKVMIFRLCVLIVCDKFLKLDMIRCSTFAMHNTTPLAPGTTSLSKVGEKLTFTEKYT
ncbi:hypothetical protein NQ315_012986 [Exocentrus adspersus]|uniref:Uncharacterized protein n=1 Tax=Exocentrus adspersus TaxID=1586481 RepID=A0AAV8VSR7_9CUCU|nr:hypothetical protein NQ315_012986 [Exocentrus adspersus]